MPETYADAKYNVVYTESTPEIYDQWAKDNYDAHAAEFMRGALLSVPQQCQRHLRRRRGIVKAMDAGCGTGNVAEVANEELTKAKLGFRYEWWGLDFSQGMLDVAAKKNIYKDLIQGDLKKKLTMYEDEQFDLITSAGTFLQGHVGSEAVAELCRITKPNGLMVFTVRPQLWEETKDEWLRELTKGGMTVLSVEHLPYAEGMTAPVVSCVKQGIAEMRVGKGKSQGFYKRAASAFLKGVEARPAAGGKEASPAREPVDELLITGLGEAIGVAAEVAAYAEAEGLARIFKVETSYPEVASGRPCALISIIVQRLK